jgi:superfamily I DNA/RNA helicase
MGVPTTTTVAFGSDFNTSISNLPLVIRGKVMDFCLKFMNNPTSPGINYEKYKGAIDKRMHSVRIDDEYRGIVFRQAESGIYIFLWVDHHDEAYAWARYRKCDVNPYSRSVQIYEIREVPANPEPKEQSSGLFSAIRDRELIKLGLPVEQLRMIRWVSNEADFLSVKEALPIDVFENLQYIIEGIPYEEVLDMYIASQEGSKDSATIAGAIYNNTSKRSFVIIDNDEELSKMINEPLKKWRVFLHPSQRFAVEQNHNGPARVLGGAGTGKTVVAMHRAKRLASEASRGEKVLFTTFTKNLARDINENLKRICTATEMRTIDTVNLDAWVGQFLRKHGQNHRVVFGEEVQGLWKDAIEKSGLELGYPAAFYVDEWSSVVCTLKDFTLQEYVRASRKGRGIRLDRKSRIQIWQVFEAYRELLESNNVRDVDTAMFDCRMMLEFDGVQSGYSSVIVDEGQDISTCAYRLIRAIAGEEHRNDIFIVGDAHQRIYGHKVVLSQCDINIRGRSKHLRINYRTTEEIRAFSLRVLKGLIFDDLDDGEDDISAEQSLMHGQMPVVKKFATQEDEGKYILEEINSLSREGIPPHEICIVARTNRIIKQYTDILRNAGVQYFEIKQEKLDDDNFPGIRVATMHRVKGLEFSMVFVASANQGILPLPSAMDNYCKVVEVEAMTSEKCLLYVAITRAKERAYITGYGELSSLVPKIGD